MKNWLVAIDSQGLKYRIFSDGTRASYMWYHDLAGRLEDWWLSRNWRHKS